MLYKQKRSCKEALKLDAPGKMGVGTTIGVSLQRIGPKMERKAR